MNLHQTAEHLYYRGHLKSCNYECSYCPFAKHPHSVKELEKDKADLDRFVGWLCDKKPHVSVMFIPYGEALIHNHYIQTIAMLSKQDNIRAISCQTNLSFRVDNFMATLNRMEADVNKINLWATFHDEMVDQNLFIEKVVALSSYIDICVGVVGTPDMIPLLKEFRRKLPPTVYLWVNAMDGLRRRYTEAELNMIQSVDPFFNLELSNPRANLDKCIAGTKSIFVSASGDCFACNRSKAPLGNLYQPDMYAIKCNARACDCFLSYVHRKDMPLLDMFGANRYIRKIKKINIKAIFLDVDGTLVDDRGIISSEIIEALKYLSSNHQIYLATSLPFIHASRKCKPIWDLLDGGVFANGADIRIFSNDYTHFKFMDMPIPKIKGLKNLEYTHQSRIYKQTMVGSSSQIKDTYESLASEYTQKYHLVLESNAISITDKYATKLEGVKQICEQLQLEQKHVMVVGNDINDIDMLKYYDHSVATLKASDLAKKYATYCLDVHHLPLFIK